MASKSDISDQQLLIFKCVLTKMIENELQKIEKNPYQYDKTLYLDVDYSPSYPLGEAAKLAHISDSVFPFKTCVKVTGQSVSMLGYGGEELFVYDSKKSSDEKNNTDSNASPSEPDDGDIDF